MTHDWEGNRQAERQVQRVRVGLPIEAQLLQRWCENSPENTPWVKKARMWAVELERGADTASPSACPGPAPATAPQGLGQARGEGLRAQDLREVGCRHR